MAKKYLSKITFPSGETYEIKDSEARALLASVGSFIVAWDGTSTPDVSKIPAGVTVSHDSSTYTGTLSASSSEVNTKAFYLVKSSTQVNSTDVYEEYVVATVGSTPSWEKIGDTNFDLSSLKGLAYKDSVTLVKGTGEAVLGEATTFTAKSSAVTFSGGSSANALGTSATFNTDIAKTENKIKATATGTSISTDSASFVKSYPGVTQKMVTTSIPNVTGNTEVSIPNVTSVGSASTWSFSVNEDTETLTISGANSIVPTLGSPLSASKVALGTAITAATGELNGEGTGATVLTGLGAASTGTALTSASVATQPTVTLSTVGDSEETAGSVSVVTEITGASTTVSNANAVAAVTSIGTATAAAQEITVGTNDKVNVAKLEDLNVSVS